MKLKVVVEFEEHFSEEEVKDGIDERIEYFKYDIRKTIEDEYDVDNVKVNITIEE